MWKTCSRLTKIMEKDVRHFWCTKMSCRYDIFGLPRAIPYNKSFYQNLVQNFHMSIRRFWFDKFLVCKFSYDLSVFLFKIYAKKISVIFGLNYVEIKIVVLCIFCKYTKFYIKNQYKLMQISLFSGELRSHFPQKK